jgi:hypothetical protein
MHSMHLNLLYFSMIIIVKVMSQSSYLLWELVNVILWGGALFVLTHCKALQTTTGHFLSCLFPYIADDIHNISPPLVVSYAYDHF